MVGYIRDLRCPPGKYFNKVKTHSGSLLDKLEMWCTDGTYQEAMGPGGGSPYEFDCARGFDEIKIRAGSKVDGMQLRCSDGRWTEWRGGHGGEEKYIKKCADKGQILTALTGVGFQGGVLALANDADRSVECGYRVDCNDDGNVFHTECKSRTDDAYKNKMKEYCNRNNGNARNSGCVDWCSRNDRDCTLLNTLNDCQKYGITEGECNSAKVVSVNAECQKYGILSTQGMNLGYQCNPNSLAKFQSDCKDLDIDINACTPDAIQSERDRQQQRAITEKAQMQAAERYAQTQAMIANIVGVPNPSTTSSTTTTEIDNNKVQFDPFSEENMLYVAISLLLMSCISSSLIAMKIKK
jgi:hypothetical protein